MARKFHGIVDFEYGTSAALSAPGTSVADVIAGESQIEFLDEEDNPVDIYGNQYAGVLYARFTIRALDLSSHGTLRTNWLADTLHFFAADLDNSERVYTTEAVRFESLRPLTIQGRRQGRADGFELTFRVPYDKLTFA